MKIRITPGAVLLLAVMAVSGGSLFPATVLCVAVHECGHLLAACLLDVRLRLLELDIPGARLVTEGLIPSYRAEWLMAAAGPAASLLLALFALPHRTPFFTAVYATTLSLALFNLLPIKHFDGGRMLSSAIAPLAGEAIADRLLAATSYVCLLLLFSLASCLLLRYGETMTLAVLSASLFTRLFLCEKA